MADEGPPVGTGNAPAGAHGATSGGAPDGAGQAGGQPNQSTSGDELTWEGLADKGIKSPADALAALAQRDEWKGHARTWESRAKEHERKLTERDRQALPDVERAAREVEDRVRADLVGKMAPEIGKAAFIAEATGKVANVQDALELVDPKRFVNDDGTVDTDQLKTTVEKLAKLAPAGATGQTPPPHVDRGARSGGRPAQLTRQDLQRLEREGRQDEIMKAQKEGRLEDLLSGKIQ